MIRQLKIWSSRNRLVYNRLAIKHKVSPARIYKLAHGYRAVTEVDSEILVELFQLGIISGIKPY